ncbi:MAG: Gfo/Idh/MocA family oxidoreductase [Oscillatoriales cyanobacterium SM2_1_8]|nr:Gfo/Idh/MocA family oxidoreductase [Oscillatoriales cyanobacterium SM2_1_8]
MLGVAVIGTGFAAGVRARLVQEDPRTHLVAIAGQPERAQTLADALGVPALTRAEAIAHPAVGLVVVANANADHGGAVREALQAGKHVVVEYPLALSWQEGEALAALATAKGVLLHVEHIELLGPIHQTATAWLPEIGQPIAARYRTIAPQRPAPAKWSYQPDRVGSPWVAALSRISRFTRWFGLPRTVAATGRYWGEDWPQRFTACLATAQLVYPDGFTVDLAYGKGEVFWQGDRTLELWGERGAIAFQGETGTLVTERGEHTATVPSPRGSFAKDWKAVLDFLTEGTPLYVSVAESLEALAVASAAAEAIRAGQVQTLALYPQLN